MQCKLCNGSNFQRDELSGNSYCARCGTFQGYDSYEAQSGGNYIRVGSQGKGSVLPYKEKKIFEASNLIEAITQRFNLDNKTEAIKSMISKITDGEFGQGEWFQILIGACCFAVVREEGKAVLLMEEIAAEIGCDLHQLGDMIKRVEDHLELKLPALDLVGLFMKTADNSLRLSDVDREKKERITKQGGFLMNCSLKWFLCTGRKPMPLVVAVLAFVIQVNGVNVKIDDLAKDAGVPLTTCKARYKELSERLVMVAQEVGLPWAKDVTVKNVVKHSGTLIGLMEAKSMRKRKQRTGDEFVTSDRFCLEDIVRDCLSKESMYGYDNDDHQDNMSRYFDVGGERQPNECNNDDDRCESQPTVCNNDNNISVRQLSTMYKEFVDGVHGGTLPKTNLGNDNRMRQSRSNFLMVSDDDWWKGKSELSGRLLLKEVLEKEVGLHALPPSYVKSCLSVERRREKINAAKLRINAIQHPTDKTCEGTSSLERKKGSEIDWEDMIIQTLVLHDVAEEEIEKGHYKTLLGLYVFNSREL